MIDSAKIEADGKIAVFHFHDGWIRRAPVDAREIIGRGQGIQEPDQEQFEQFLEQFPAAQRERLLVWPAAFAPPAWMGEVLAKVKAALAAPAAPAPVAPAPVDPAPVASASVAANVGAPDADDGLKPKTAKK